MGEVSLAAGVRALKSRGDCYTGAMTHAQAERIQPLRTRAGNPGESALIEPNAEHHYHVSEADLPLSCPMPGMYLWNSHPKVYLPIAPTGQAKCPYCGATYSLERARPGDSVD